MKNKSDGFARRYQSALQKHLQQGPRTNLQSARNFGRRVVNAGLETLDLARVHEHAMSALIGPEHSARSRKSMARRAETFFAESIIPLEQTRRTAHEVNAHLGQTNDVLRQRTVELASSNRQLQLEINQRKLAQELLKKSERHYGQLLEQSRQMQDQLRLLSRQLLSAQEEERKKISRELHDVIAQTLTGIMVRLDALKKEAGINTEGLGLKIARTQELVQRSVDIVHRFARELRPAVLDDLGLIPALHTFLKNFREHTGIHVSLAAFAAVEQVNGDKRTVLYRVAQEALTNVARHAQASEAEVRIQKQNESICMTIRDNGKGFDADRLSRGIKNKRLGLLGMRERVEMVGGNFAVQSSRGKGATVIAQIPLAGPRGRKSADRVRKAKIEHL